MKALIFTNLIFEVFHFDFDFGGYVFVFKKESIEVDLFFEIKWTVKFFHST